MMPKRMNVPLPSDKKNLASPALSSNEFASLGDGEDSSGMQVHFTKSLVP
jgi:hypothetical protein